MLDPRLEDLPGVGTVTARRLATVGITSVRDLAAARADALTVLPRLGQRRGEALVAAARAVLAAAEVPGARPTSPDAAASGRGGKKATKAARKAAKAEDKAARKADKKAEKKAAKKTEKRADKKAAKERKKAAKAAKGRG